MVNNILNLKSRKIVNIYKEIKVFQKKNLYFDKIELSLYDENDNKRIVEIRFNKHIKFKKIIIKN